MLIVQFYSRLTGAFIHHSSRRSMVKGTVAGFAGLAGIAGVGGGAYFLTQQNQPSHAAGIASPETIQTILNIAATAEQGGVVFYTQASTYPGASSIPP